MSEEGAHPGQGDSLWNYPDIWMNMILPFVGPGNSESVVGVAPLEDMYHEYLCSPTLWNLLRGNGHEEVTAVEASGIWRNIMSFVGPGKYIFVAGAHPGMRRLYLECFSKFKECLLLVARVPIRLTSTHTFVRKAVWEASTNGQVRTLQFLREQVPSGASNFIWAEVTVLASSSGHLNVLKWARAQDPPCPWDVDPWLWEGDPDNGFEETCKEYSSASENGHLHILQWLRAQDPPRPWNAESCDRAAAGGHLHILQWLRAQNPPCPWDSTSCLRAADSGHLHILKWLRAQDPPCPWNKYTCERAAGSGHLHILQWLRAQNPPCPWHEDMWRAAVRGGNLSVLEWLREQSTPFHLTVQLMECAVEWGHLDVVQWLHSNGCPWGEEITVGAFQHGRVEILRWLRSQDPPCPWNKSTYNFVMRKAVSEDNQEMLEWLREEEVPSH